MQTPRSSFFAQLPSLATALAAAVFALTVSALPACGAGEPGDGSDEATGALEDESVADATDGGVKPKTWISIYDEAFAPGTPGHCGNSGCHGTLQAGFLCGSTSSSCLAGMITKGLLSTKTPTASLLGSKTGSPLRWVHTGGPMPADNKIAEPKLAADIEAWVKAGAPGITTTKDGADDETSDASDGEP